MCDFLNNLAAELVGSALFAIIAFILLRIYKRTVEGYKTEDRLFACDLWWLPGWQVWRFVIRNMPGDKNLYNLRYRTWLRRHEPPRAGCSVTSYFDIPLEAGERQVLLAGQDLPILCFRFENNGSSIAFIHTDKLGAPIKSINIEEQFYEIMAEYIFLIEGRFDINYSISRLLSIPKHIEHPSIGRVDLFSYILHDQAKDEHSIKVVFTDDEQISISYPH